MKQLKMSFQLTRKFWIYFGLFLGTLLIIGAVLFYLLIYSKDQLVRYVPNDTFLYFGLKSDIELFSNPIFQRIFFDDQEKAFIQSLLRGELQGSLRRNYGLALVPISKKDYAQLHIFALNKPWHSSLVFEEFLQKRGLEYLSLDDKWLGRHLLFLSDSREVLQKVKDVSQGQGGSLADDLEVNFSLNNIISSSGGVYLNSSDFLRYLQGDDLSRMKRVLQDFRAEKIFFKVTDLRSGLVLQTPNYLSGDKELEVYKPSELSFAVRLGKNSLQKMNDFNNLPKYLQEFVSIHDDKLKDLFNGLDASKLELYFYSSQKWLLSLSLPNFSEKDLVALRDGFREYLAVANKKEVFRNLPDGSKILTLVKNYDSLVMEEKNVNGNHLYILIDQDNIDRYIFSLKDGAVLLGKNISSLYNDDFQKTTLEGCFVSDDIDYFLWSPSFGNTDNVLSSLFTRVVVASSDTTYPQISACFY